MLTTRARHAAFVLLAAPLLLLLAHATAHAGKPANAADPLPLPEAEARLDAASSILRQYNAPSGEVTRALERLAEAHARAGGTARKRAAYRRKAEGLFVKALMSRRPRHATRYANIWHDVNMLAAKLLGDTAAVLQAKEARKLSLRIRTALTDKVAKRRKPDEWHADHLVAAFAALAALNDHETLLWMVDTYRHHKEREIPFLIAAHSAMVGFKDVPGKVRHEVCKTMIQAYAGVESAAERASNSPSDVAKKRIWDRIRLTVIPVLQKYAGQPRNDEGHALSTVGEFQVWWQDHENPRKPPWKD